MERLRILRERDDVRTWSAGCAVFDGRVPALWFHGTTSDADFNIFTRWDELSVGYHFGTLNAAQARVDAINGFDPAESAEAVEGTLIPVLLRVRSPLRLPDLHTWSQTALAGALLDAGVVDPALADFVAASCQAEIAFAAIETAGFDAVVYDNLCEAPGSTSVLVWRAEQIKGLFAERFDPADPRILPQAVTAEDDLRDWEANTRLLERARADVRGVLSG